MDNSGIDGDYKSGIENQFYIHLDIAKAFNLVIPKNGSPGADDKGYQSSSLVMAEHFRDPMSSTAAIGGVLRLWSVIDGGQVGLRPEGTATKSWFLPHASSRQLVLLRTRSFFSEPLVSKTTLLGVYRSGGNTGRRWFGN